MKIFKSLIKNLEKNVLRFFRKHTKKKVSNGTAKKFVVFSLKVLVSKIKFSVLY
jgi:hypothetical protein